MKIIYLEICLEDTCYKEFALIISFMKSYIMKTSGLKTIAAKTSIMEIL